MPIILEHPSIPSGPGLNASIWRYSSLTKLLSLLVSKSLYFPSVDSLMVVDPYEGRHTDVTLATFTDQLAAIIGSAVTDPEKRAIIEAQVRQIGLVPIAHRPGEMFVSCWHVNEFESDALWRLYSDLGAGVAIKTTVERLVASIECDSVWGGSVRYEDYSTFVSDFGNGFVPYFLKRKSYEHEREFRLLHWDTSRAAELRPGVSFPCNVSKLIEVIHVSPYADRWVVETVRNVVSQLGCTAEVLRSTLLELK